MSSWNVAVDALEHAVALDEHVLVGVDQDVADRRIAQQRLERPEAEHVVESLDEQRFALAEAERRAFFARAARAAACGFRLSARGAVGLGERLEVQAVQQLAMDAGPKLQILRGCGGRMQNRTRTRPLSPPGARRRASRPRSQGLRATAIERLRNVHESLPERRDALEIEQTLAAAGRVPLLAAGVENPPREAVELSSPGPVSPDSASGTPELSAVDTVL